MLAANAHAIVLGTASSLGSHVVRVVGASGATCSGTVIDKQHVVTARHCSAVGIMLEGKYFGAANRAQSVKLGDGRTISVHGDAMILIFRGLVSTGAVHEGRTLLLCEDGIDFTGDPLGGDVGAAFDDFMRSFEAFKSENDTRLDQIERRSADVLSDHKVERINSALTEQKRVLEELVLRGRRPSLAGNAEQHRRHAEGKRDLARGDVLRLDKIHILRRKAEALPI